MVQSPINLNGSLTLWNLDKSQGTFASFVVVIQIDRLSTFTFSAT